MSRQKLAAFVGSLMIFAGTTLVLGSQVGSATAITATGQKASNTFDGLIDPIIECGTDTNTFFGARIGYSPPKWREVIGSSSDKLSARDNGASGLDYQGFDSGFKPWFLAVVKLGYLSSTPIRTNLFPESALVPGTQLLWNGSNPLINIVSRVGTCIPDIPVTISSSFTPASAAPTTVTVSFNCRTTLGGVDLTHSESLTLGAGDLTTSNGVATFSKKVMAIKGWSCSATQTPAGVFTLTSTSPAGTASTTGKTTITGATSYSFTNSYADLRVSMSDGSSTYTPGEQATYTITVENVGGVNVKGASILDTLPDAALLNATDTTWSCTSPSGCPTPSTASGPLDTTFDLAPGNTLTFTQILKTKPEALGDSTSVVNVTLPATLGEATPQDNRSSDSDTAAPKAKIGIMKTSAAPHRLNAGGQVDWYITVTNDGPSFAHEITVTDPTPASTSLAAAPTIYDGATTSASTSGLSCATAGTPVVLTCGFGQLEPGKAKVIKVTYSLPANYFLGGAPALIVNTATVAANESKPLSASDTVTPVDAPGLYLKKSGPSGFVVPGSQVTYSVTFGNTGPSDAGSVLLTDVAPPELSLVSVSGGVSGGPVCSTLPCSIGTLAVGASGFVNLTYAIPASYSGTEVTTTTTLTSSSPVAPVTSSTSTTTSIPPTIAPSGSSLSAVSTNGVQPTADVSMTMTLNGSEIVPGTNVAYTLTLTNAGPSDARDVLVSNPVPSALSLVSVSGRGCTSLPCNIGTLAGAPAYESASIVVTFSVPASAVGTVTNTASVTVFSPAVNLLVQKLSLPEAKPLDPDFGDNEAAITTTLTPKADISVRTTGPDVVQLGGTATYTLVVTNAGPSDSGMVTVTFPTPSLFDLVAVSGGGCSSFPCAIGPMANGSSVTVTATYAPKASDSVVVNVATVASVALDPRIDNNSASLTTLTTMIAPFLVPAGPAVPPAAAVTTTTVTTTTVPTPSTTTPGPAAPTIPAVDLASSVPTSPPVSVLGNQIVNATPLADEPAFTGAASDGLGITGAAMILAGSLLLLGVSLQRRGIRRPGTR